MPHGFLCSRSSDGVYKSYKEIVIEGQLATQGMPKFKGLISESELSDLQDFIFYSADEFTKGTGPQEYMGNIAQMQFKADQVTLKN